MSRAAVNGVELEYEVQGPESGRPLILVRGLGTQMIHWHPEFLARLAERGQRLVIFDNRDTGLSSHFDAAGTPSLAEISAATPSRRPPSIPYGLSEMAQDVVGLMDVLELESAHIAGMSMGGMIVQQVALQSPERVRSVISIMSSTGEGGLPRATPEAQAALMETAPDERGAYLEYSVRTQRCFAGDGFPFDETGWRELAGRAFDRAFDPAGIARQFAAVATSGSRHEKLASLGLPCLVLHGGNDPLIPPEAGIATAQTIPDAELRIIEGMGHDLPRGAWPELVAAISAHTEKAEKH